MVAVCPNIQVTTGTVNAATLQTENEDFAIRVQTSISTNHVDNTFLSQTLVGSIFVRMLAETGALTTSTTNVQYFKQEVNTLGTSTQ